MSSNRFPASSATVRALKMGSMLMVNGAVFSAVCPAKCDSFASLQKLCDLLPRQGLGVLHLYLHSAAHARLPHLSCFQDHLVLESSSVSESSCIG
jgi:hypothetical protein